MCFSFIFCFFIVIYFFFFFFFFSSRRRHTRCLSDWSSDVCSSDLRQRIVVDVVLAVAVDAQVAGAGERAVVLVAALARQVVVHALEREVTDVVQRLDVLPGPRRVALRAAGAVLALVDRGLGMAAEA